MEASKREMLLIEFLTSHSRISYPVFPPPFKTNDKFQVVLTPKQFGTYFVNQNRGEKWQNCILFSLLIMYGVPARKY